VRIVVVCVGRLRSPPFADDVSHYERLLRRHARVEIQEIREAGGDAARAHEVLRKEGREVLSRVPTDAFLSVLDREGEAVSSVDFARFIEARRRSGRDAWFAVGGPFGFAAEVLERADARLSLGRVTLPHQLARVVLLEQLFRAHKILSGEPYHY
jgi:23S rRNA (pseudouridine1915-N3)-methyltransferase